MKIAWRLNGHNLTEQELIFGNCLSESWAEPLLIRHLADSEYADTKDAKTLIKKLQGATYADLVCAVERLGF